MYVYDVRMSVMQGNFVVKDVIRKLDVRSFKVLTQAR